MSRKLAIAISGAVSLGSYEAGVMYEVLEAIAQHNEKLAKDSSSRIEIDVITGASAGGMTAGILAQKLLCDGKELRKPYDNPLYHAWVNEVDIEKLLDKDKREYKFSLLSSKAVEGIAGNHIKDSPLLHEAHPSAAKEIFVGIAMSNLNGWDYTVKPNNTDGDSEFVYTRYKDRFVCRLDHSVDGINLFEISLSHKSEDGKKDDEWVDMHPTSWQKLRECSVSSGAFPFAFEVRKITRCPGKGEFAGRESNTYSYTDGGVFENEPLGLAKKLAEWVDDKESSITEKTHEEPNKHFYLYVAPGNKTSTSNINFGRTEQIDLWTTLKALLAAIFNQARFQDWIIKDLDNKSPIFQITTKNDKLIGELLSAFAGFLDIRFRFYDYNIGRESAREALEKFSKNTSNPNLAYWKELGEEDQLCLKWEVVTKKGGKGEKDITLPVNRATHEAYANGSIDDLLKAVDLSKREKIQKAIGERLMALIDLVNDKLDEEDRKKSVLLGSVRRLIRRLWTFVIVKPTVWIIAGRFLHRKLLLNDKGHS
ncbi:patatin-like phospholipase family protein [Pseudanabaena sp. BC1403]|uniref:patatin-like phospholipase family protein n=1 Tax=Pseudanabaena sp. BC1403 TaxID=2043171 RepID=UPI000CD8557C|nr:patatin-like phospholipase family protein [Pseudanabaena sp. BC1403]